MPSVRIWEGDLTKLVLEKYKEKAFKVEPVKMTFTVEVKEIVEALTKYPLFKQEVHDATSEAMKKIAASAANELKVKSEKAFNNWQANLDYTDFDTEMKEFLKEYKDIADEAPKQVQEATKKAWDAFVKENKEYSKYKWKTVGKIGLCVVGVGTAVAVAASAGLGNIPGLVAGTVGAARSLSTGFQTCITFAKSAEKIGLELRNDLGALVADYKTMSKKAVTASEVISKAIDAFTTISLTSIKKCENNLATFKGKLAGLKVAAHKAASDLDKILDGNERIEKEIKAIKAKGIESTLLPVLAKSEQLVDATIAQVGELVERVKKGKEAAEKAERLIADLKQKLNNKVFTVASAAIDVSVLALEVWGGFGSDGAGATSIFLETPAEKAELAAIGLKTLSGAVEVAEKQMRR